MHPATTTDAAFEREVDIAWLSAFRALFGCTMAISMWRFIDNGWIDEFFLKPRVHFKYWGFAWVEPLTPPAFHLAVAVFFGAAIFTAAGLFFRVSALVLFVGITYLQLIDVTTYLNHYYLASLLAFLLVLSPAGRFLSLDTLLLKRRSASSIPATWLYLLRFQVGVVYTFAGIAKATSDWLVHAEPLRIWLSSRTGYPVLGPSLSRPGPRPS